MSISLARIILIVQFWMMLIIANAQSPLSARHPNLPESLPHLHRSASSKPGYGRALESQKKVRFVYLVPTDSAIKPTYTLAIKNAALQLQSWYKDQLGVGKSFSLSEPIVEVYHSTHNSEWYSTNPKNDWAGQWKFWFNEVDDAFALSGGTFEDEDNFWIVYLDALPACPMLQGGGLTHVAAMGANDLRGLLGKSWIPICDEVVPNYSSCRYVGGLGHELGHAFGLPHTPGCDDGQPIACDGNSIMFTGYLNYPNCYFTQNEKSALLSSPFISNVTTSSCPIDCANLTIENAVSKLNQIAICEGSTYFAGGKLQSAPGTYVDVLHSRNGCDSIVTTVLSIPPRFSVTRSVSICKGESYFAAGKLQDQSGTYTDQYLSKRGCDSLITTQLTVLPTFKITKEVSICQGQSHFAGGAAQTVSGTFTDNYKSKKGCDSVVVTNLRVSPVYHIVKTVSICQGQSYRAGGALQTTAGDYIDKYATKLGCDSVITTRITIVSSFEIVKPVTICSGQSYFAAGKQQTLPGDYKDLYHTKAGCDSTVVTRLTLIPNYQSQRKVSICGGEKYFAGGEFQSMPGMYYDTFKTKQGCDSVIVTTLELLSKFETTKNVTICEGQTYFTGGGFQTKAGTYTDNFKSVQECDSVIITHLNVTSSYENTIDVSICNGESYYASGAFQTQTGIYRDAFTSRSGCDSLIVTRLTAGICTGIGENIDMSVAVYPVPAESILFIQAPSIHHCELINLMGQTIRSTTNTYITLEEIPDGQYLVRIYYEKDKFMSKKVVLKH